MTRAINSRLRCDSAAYFQQYADPRFRLEYVIAVTNQFGLGKVVLFGFGRMEGMSYPEDPPPSRKSGGTPRALK